MADDGGATPSKSRKTNLPAKLTILEERVLEACRHDNLELLVQVLPSEETAKAALLNVPLDVFGKTSLHVAAGRGSIECLQYILEQEGIELEPKETTYGDTPLHQLIRLFSENHGGQNAKEEGTVEYAVAVQLLNSGTDPRVKNKDDRRPSDLIWWPQSSLKILLLNAELAMTYAVDDDVSDAASDGGSETD